MARKPKEPPIAPAPHRHLLHILREDLFGASKESFAQIVKQTTKTIYINEAREQDFTTLEQIRLCYQEANRRGLKWPWHIVIEAIERDEKA